MSIIKGIKVQKGRFMLDLPDMEVLDSGVTAFIGSSGSGKSTLFRVIMGLDMCPSFSWEIAGVDIGRLSIPERGLGVVFQNLELFPHMTAEQNILFAAEARGIPSHSASQSLDRLAKSLGLGGTVMRTSTSYLSGGERQRVALARALVAQPRALLLDEPFSALDEGHRAEARALVKSVLQELEIPTLLITHDQRDTDELANKIYRLKSGKLDT